MQNLFSQILQDQVMAAGKGDDESTLICMALHRHGGQLKAHDPPFRAGFQCFHLYQRQVQAHPLVEECDSLIDGEGQVIDSHLG